MTLTKNLTWLALATAVLLAIPLVAMQFTEEVRWTFSDFVFAGGLLFGTGLTYVVVAQRGGNRTYRLAVAVAVVAALLLVWANAAVGLVGSEDNPANILYGGVLLVAIGGAVLAQLRPAGMARAMFAAALTYGLVTVVALFGWPATGAAAEPALGLTNVLGANALLAALWVGAGLLFWRAAGAPEGRQLT